VGRCSRSNSPRGGEQGGWREIRVVPKNTTGPGGILQSQKQPMGGEGKKMEKKKKNVKGPMGRLGARAPALLFLPKFFRVGAAFCGSFTGRGLCTNRGTLTRESWLFQENGFGLFFRFVKVFIRGGRGPPPLASRLSKAAVRTPRQVR